MLKYRGLMIPFIISSDNKDAHANYSDDADDADYSLDDATRLLTIDEIPPWYAENPFILSGYRPVFEDAIPCFESWLYLHNQTLNILTHLIPGLCAVLVNIAFFYFFVHWYPDATFGDRAVLHVYLTACAVCFGVSATYHTLLCHSHEAADRWVRLDYAGISVLILGSFVPGLYNGFYCEPMLFKGYLAMIISMGLLNIYQSMKDHYGAKNFVHQRLLPFLGLGFSAFIPIIHAAIIFPYEQLQRQAGLNYYYVEGLCMLIGVVFLATKFPERALPGFFDCWGSSHQIFHCFVVLGAMCHFAGILSAFDWNYNNPRCLVPWEYIYYTWYRYLIRSFQPLNNRDNSPCLFPSNHNIKQSRNSRAPRSTVRMCLQVTYTSRCKVSDCLQKLDSVVQDPGAEISAISDEAITHIEDKGSSGTVKRDDKTTTKLEKAGDGDDDGSPMSGDEGDSSDYSKYESSLVYRILTPINCRWNAKVPRPLTTRLSLLYAISATFTVANLYYNQPILNKIAREFNVSYEESSSVATLMQAGYAAGLVFILPLGDMLERRPFIICLVFMTATMWIGLCVTDNFTVFRALSFICGATTVTPQLMIPLVGDFAPAHRKAASLSIVVSGLMLGMLVARFLAGVVANFTSWRNIYWVSCGAQYVLAMTLYCCMPDYPSTNPDGLNYFRALWSIPYMMATEPVLIQSCLIVFTLSCVFTSFWTTLTFLLASDPYNYSSLQIGLFSLTLLATILTIPVIGRSIDHYVPLIATMTGQFVVLTGVTIGTFIGTFTIAGPILQAISLDVGIQTSQIANRAAIFNINPMARNRVNTAYMASAFAGQLTGTAVGNKLYANGGWRWSGGCSMAFIGASILFALARGPRETGWVGWKGGWRPRRDATPAPQQQGVESGIVSKEKQSEA
ncbi:hypothetical protein G7046_g28 [Stylonectria norvegica]|nr:hypothetical protein G7046_g28 [Stylonectria norvegica]